MSGSRVPCEPCRTINLAKTILEEKGKGCTPLRKPDCSGIPELRLNPACIRVCNQDPKNKPKVALPKTPVPYYAHGKFLWVVKTGILVGSVYFTYTQGVWGDQQTSMECLNRWAEYIHSINTRRPPKFDECGNVVRSGSSLGRLSEPLYSTYKECVTTCFAGVVKVPMLIKCAYINYLESLEKKMQQEKLEAGYKKNK